MTSVPASPASKLPLSLLTLPTFSTASSSRLQSLYSDFSRQKHSNPASFHANVEWWRQTLERYVQDGLQNSRLVLTAGRSLIDSLRVDGAGKPIGLRAVITELSSSTSNAPPPFIPLSAFLSAPRSIYDNATSIPYLLASYLVAKPLWWALEQLGVTGEEGILSSSSSSKHSTTSWHGDYVLVNLVEEAAESILSQQQNATTPGEYLYTFDGFRATFSSCLGLPENVVMSEIDAKVLLRYLERDKGVVVFSKDTIKFVDRDASAETRRVTAVDVGILELKTAVKNLRDQVEGIQRRIDECTEKAAAAVREKQKEVAASYLRTRKQLQQLFSKRLASLDNLESTLLSVEAAAGDIEIMSAFQSSTATLRAILSHPLLQRESIESTMEAMAEANAEAKEVDETIKIGGDVALGVEDYDVEDELQGLVEEAEREKALKEKEVEDKLERLPSVQSQPERQEGRAVPIPA